jgi:hypothetical protein
MMDSEITPEYEAWVMRKRKEFERIGRKHGHSPLTVAMDILAVLTPDDQIIDVRFRKEA